MHSRIDTASRAIVPGFVRDLNLSKRAATVGSVLVVGALCLMSACGQGALETIVVAPRPIVRVDSAATAAFSTSVLAVMRQVATEDSLAQFFGHAAPFARRETWLACFGYAGFWTNFTYCARMQDSVMTILLQETGPGFYHSTFDEHAERLRRHVIQSLRDEFGEHWGWVCARSWKKSEACPRLIQVDSSGQAPR